MTSSTVPLAGGMNELVKSPERAQYLHETAIGIVLEMVQSLSASWALAYFRTFSAHISYASFTKGLHPALLYGAPSALF
ncbi:MAG: hypothetical protein ACK417_05065 [Bacteroidia bacterium]